jgi:histidinol dehydrogenase
MGLPYPKLEIYAQSFLDTYNVMALTDLIDAMDLSEEWGAEHLDLSGTNHVEWARQKNKRIGSLFP